jgi:hypothetical protein
MNKRRVYHSFKREQHVKPDTGETVVEFLRSFGARTHVHAILNFAGLACTRKAIEEWERNAHMPREAFEALKGFRTDGMKASRIANVDPTRPDGDIVGLDIYFKDVLVGRFNVARGIKVVARKRHL